MRVLERIGETYMRKDRKYIEKEDWSVVGEPVLTPDKRIVKTKTDALLTICYYYGLEVLSLYNLNHFLNHQEN